MVPSSWCKTWPIVFICLSWMYTRYAIFHFAHLSLAWALYQSCQNCRVILRILLFPFDLSSTVLFLPCCQITLSIVNLWYPVVSPNLPFLRLRMCITHHWSMLLLQSVLICWLLLPVGSQLYNLVHEFQKACIYIYNWSSKFTKHLKDLFMLTCYNFQFRPWSLLLLLLPGTVVRSTWYFTNTYCITTYCNTTSTTSTCTPLQ